MRRHYYSTLFHLTLIIVIFIFALGTPARDSAVKDFFTITGNAVKVENEGCVTNVYDDYTMLELIRDRIDFSRYYNLVVFKGFGDYYLLYYHNGVLKDSYGKPYDLVKGDLICYDFENLPGYVET